MMWQDFPLGVRRQGPAPGAVGGERGGIFPESPSEIPQGAVGPPGLVLR